MGKLWDILQGHIDAQLYPVSDRQIAKALRVSPTTITNWKNPRDLPSQANLRAIATLTGVAYMDVLRAALEDAGYLEGGARDDASPMTAAEWDVRAAELRAGPRPLSPQEVVQTLGRRPSPPGEALGGYLATDRGHSGLAPDRRLSTWLRS